MEDGRVRKSAIWDGNGDLFAVAPENDDSIVISVRENEAWKTKLISAMDIITNN